MSLSSILASTLDNRQLFQQIQRRSAQLETSAEVSRIASTILDPDELLPEVVELIKTGFNLYYAGIFLVDEDGELTGESNRWAVLRAGSGLAGQQMLEAGHKLKIGGGSMIGSAIFESTPRVTSDVGEEANFFRNPYLPETRSEMALPLVSRGQVLGAITIQSEREAAFTEEDITSLQTMADQIANAIENARLFEQTELRAEELTVLNEMARAYTQTMDVDKLVDYSFEFTGRLINADNYYLALYSPESNLIEFMIFVEEGVRIPAPEPKIYLGEGLTDWIITNKLPVLMPDSVEEHMRNMGVEIRGRSAESWLGVPMLIGNNVLGVIAVQSYEKEIRYNNRDMDLLSSVASQTAVAIDNALRFQQTQARAKYEQILREITTRVHTSTNAEAILKTAVREVSTALGRQAFIELNLEDEGKILPNVESTGSHNGPAEDLSTNHQAENQPEEQ
jgi:GAF domain-containing protein